MMVANSQKHHCRVRPYTREVLVLSTNLEIQTKHCPLVFRNRRGDEARIKKTFGDGVVISCFFVHFSPIAYSLSYFDSFDIPSDLLSVLMTPLIFTDIPFDLIFAIMILIRKGLLGPSGGSGGTLEGRFGEHYGGNDGIGGSMFGVVEGKDESMGGMRGGSLARRSMVSNDGREGGGLVVAGGRSSRCNIP
ncbi:hypothetical protein Tco_0773318 [Tanacetum coccineum]|uniref:Uncharacterized protein n=1 Tax=Tanacetum coccineum TaxID=301880 RepID=A0ABQ4ZNE5_9ASTR